MDNIMTAVALESGLPLRKVVSTAALLDDDKTIPFIARYRKEVTGELDEVQIRQIDELLKFFRSLAQRKEEVLRHIGEQGQLTPDIEAKLRAARKLTEVEDIYRPFRPKRRTRASMARDKGLQGLADYLLHCPALGDPQQEARNYLNEQVDSPAAALQGARDILAETLADDPGLRQAARNLTRRAAVLVTKVKDADKDSVYSMYYDYREPVNRIPAHRILAINRAEKEEVIRVSLEQDLDTILQMLNHRFVKIGPAQAQLEAVATDAWLRLLAPAIERDIRSELTEKAQVQALQVFARNLRSLLLQAPVPGKTILGIDPAYRTGCKWAAVDPTGSVLEIGVFYPTPPRREIKQAQTVMQRLVETYQVDAIAIGNGTASRETEAVVADFIQQSRWPQLAYTIVSEAGASVYSASELAAAEFPVLDVSERSAISIARRIQDPLAELVKIDPKSIGVGQYQHDLPAKQLEESLSAVVESAVNYVGVDLNTASAALLTYVAGINATVAKNVVSYRDANGPYSNRRQLLKVPKLGPKAYEQAAGFLRISAGVNPLDATPIHPESYPMVTKLLKYLDADLQNLGSATLRAELQTTDLHQLADALGAGLPTLKDVAEALLRPGRDPREDVPPPIFRQDILNLEAIQIGMELEGVVRNVVDFGAFVDIGVKADGLVHISEMSTRRIKHPLEIVSTGDIVKVRVITIDREQQRIGLSMKL